jgi:hypothetical protein
MPTIAQRKQRVAFQSNGTSSAPEFAKAAIKSSGFVVVLHANGQHEVIKEGGRMVKPPRRASRDEVLSCKLIRDDN